jgi:hypothetical protein
MSVSTFREIRYVKSNSRSRPIRQASDWLSLATNLLVEYWIIPTEAVDRHTMHALTQELYPVESRFTFLCKIKQVFVRPVTVILRYKVPLQMSGVISHIGGRMNGMSASSAAYSGTLEYCKYL